MTKTYQTINDINLSTSVKVGEKHVIIKFFGGSVTPEGKISRFGTFSTPDSDVQKAIEEDGGYGKSFTCINAADDTDLGTLEAVSNNSDDTGKKEVPDISNTNLAIEWIEANTEHKFTGRPSKAEVLEVATSLNITFVDWK